MQTRKVLSWITLIVLAAAAVVALLLPLPEFEIAKVWMDGLSDDGSFERFTADYYRALCTRIRYSGLLVLAAGAVIVFAPPLLIASKLGDNARPSALKQLAAGWQAITLPHQIIFIALCAVGFALRIRNLNDPITYDEAYTILHYVQKPWYVTVSDYTYPNNHILSSLSIKVSTFLFGDGLWAYRLPSFLAGFLCIPLAFVAARQFMPALGALIFSAFIVFYMPFVEYGAMARGYSLVFAGVLAQLLVAGELLKAPRRQLYWWLSLLVALSIWAVPIALLPAGAIYGWLLIKSPHRTSIFISGAVALASTALLYLPVLLINHSEFAGGAKIYLVENGTIFSLIRQQALTLWEYWTKSYSAVPPMLLLVFWVFGAIKNRQLKWLALLSVCLLVLPIFVNSTVFFPRFFNGLIILFFLVGAAGISRLPLRMNSARQSSLATTLALLLVTSVTWRSIVAPSWFNRSGEAEQFLLEHSDKLQVGDKLILAFPLRTPLQFYAARIPIDLTTYDIPGAQAKRFIFLTDSWHITEPEQLLVHYPTIRISTPPKLVFQTGSIKAWEVLPQ